MQDINSKKNTRKNIDYDNLKELILLPSRLVNSINNFCDRKYGSPSLLKNKKKILTAKVYRAASYRICYTLMCMMARKPYNLVYNESYNKVYIPFAKKFFIAILNRRQYDLINYLIEEDILEVFQDKNGKLFIPGHKDINKNGEFNYKKGRCRALRINDDLISEDLVKVGIAPLRNTKSNKGLLHKFEKHTNYDQEPDTIRKSYQKMEPSLFGSGVKMNTSDKDIENMVKARRHRMESEPKGRLSIAAKEILIQEDLIVIRNKILKLRTHELEATYCKTNGRLTHGISTLPREVRSILLRSSVEIDVKNFHPALTIATYNQIAAGTGPIVEQLDDIDRISLFENKQQITDYISSEEGILFSKLARAGLLYEYVTREYNSRKLSIRSNSKHKQLSRTVVKKHMISDMFSSYHCKGKILWQIFPEYFKLKKTIQRTFQNELGHVTFCERYKSFENYIANINSRNKKYSPFRNNNHKYSKEGLEKARDFFMSRKPNKKKDGTMTKISALSCGSSLFPVCFQKTESNIFIENILIKLNKNNIFPITNHDSIICSKKDQDSVFMQIKNTMNKFIGKNNYELSITTLG